MLKKISLFLFWTATAFAVDFTITHTDQKTYVATYESGSLRYVVDGKTITLPLVDELEPLDAYIRGIGAADFHQTAESMMSLARVGKFDGVNLAIGTGGKVTEVTPMLTTRRGPFEKYGTRSSRTVTVDQLREALPPPFSVRFADASAPQRYWLPQSDDFKPKYTEVIIFERKEGRVRVATVDGLVNMGLTGSQKFDSYWIPADALLVGTTRQAHPTYNNDTDVYHEERGTSAVIREKCIGECEKVVSNRATLPATFMAELPELLVQRDIFLKSLSHDHENSFFSNKPAWQATMEIVATLRGVGKLDHLRAIGRDLQKHGINFFGERCPFDELRN